jgi:predicted Fe-S protein YdhL (DUF1289 family)
MQQPIASPCIRQCCLSADDICLGCHRSLDEIMRWGSAPAEEKLRILALVRLRAARSRASGT